MPLNKLSTTKSGIDTNFLDLGKLKPVDVSTYLSSKQGFIVLARARNNLVKPTSWRD